jgi:protein TonB
VTAEALRQKLLAPELKPYLGYSLAAHASLGAVLLGLIPFAGKAPPSRVYTIDFVGPSATIVSSVAGEAKPAAAAPAPASEKQAPQTEFDEFGRRKKKGHFVLPRPSLLKGFQAKKPEEPKEEEPPAQTAPAAAPAQTAAGGAAGNSPGDAGISTDMPDFPYPWYISQVRQALWNNWSARMPRMAGECVVQFSILRNGGIVDLRTEVSSGDSSFDLAALGAAQDSAPFPPLPQGFADPFLRVHLTLKAGGPR